MKSCSDRMWQTCLPASVLGLNCLSLFSPVNYPRTLKNLREGQVGREKKVMNGDGWGGDGDDKKERERETHGRRTAI